MIAPYVVADAGPRLARARDRGAAGAGGTSVNLKLELFQQSGTFKARGALSKMMRLDARERARGVTAVSAGNHAIATAYAALLPRRLGQGGDDGLGQSGPRRRLPRARRRGA